MTTERISRARAGYVDGKRQPCRWCGKMPEGRRLTFCSDECVRQHKIRTQPDFAASLVLERDHGVCCSCGLDTVRLFDEMRVELLAAACRQVRSKAKNSHRCQQYANRYSWDCGHEECVKVEAESMMRDWFGRHHWNPLLDPEYARACASRGLPEKFCKLKRRLWEMDHIVPVVEGGGDCGLDNLRTLCWACHGRETARLAARRAEKRKATG